MPTAGTPPAAPVPRGPGRRDIVGDDSVDTPEAWGLGNYRTYNVDPGIRQDHGFRTPVEPGVKSHSLLVVSPGGMGHHHVVNDTGASTVPAGTSPVPSTVVSHP